MSIGKWTSVTDALPGAMQNVFVYSDKTGEVVGPAYIAVHKGTEIKQRTGTEINLNTGENFEIFERIGVFALAWCSGGMIFTRFMPTHWTPFPSLPPKAEE